MTKWLKPRDGYLLVGSELPDVRHQNNFIFRVKSQITTNICLDTPGMGLKENDAIFWVQEVICIKQKTQ